jgi:hypothetical protein
MPDKPEVRDHPIPDLPHCQPHLSSRELFSTRWPARPPPERVLVATAS